jgi:hypothetical protein
MQATSAVILALPRARMGLCEASSTACRPIVRRDLHQRHLADSQRRPAG